MLPYFEAAVIVFHLMFAGNSLLLTETNRNCYKKVLIFQVSYFLLAFTDTNCRVLRTFNQGRRKRAMKGKNEGFHSENIESWLRLIRAEGVGPITFRRLLEHFGDLDPFGKYFVKL